MSETMVKKQLEGSEIQTGACHYCGQVYQFETDGRATETQLDKWAEEKCGCGEAALERQWREKADEAKQNTEELFGESFPEACEILKEGIDLIVRHKATKVAVDAKGGKLSVQKSKNGIKAEISRTEKKEYGGVAWRRGRASCRTRRRGSATSAASCMGITA